MKHIYRAIIIVSVLINSAYGNDSGLTTFVQYQQGSPVLLHLEYEGGVSGWDAGASVANGILILSNAMFMSVTDSKNDPVKPIDGKVLSVWADTYFRDPFSLVIDISKFYNLSRSGRYLLRWGCKGVSEDRMFIEILDSKLP